MHRIVEDENDLFVKLGTKGWCEIRIGIVTTAGPGVAEGGNRVETTDAYRAVSRHGSCGISAALYTIGVKANAPQIAGPPDTVRFRRPTD